MAEAFIALTIKVTYPSDVQLDARVQAETVSRALSTLLQSGGRWNVYTSVIEGSEAAAVDRLADMVQS